MSKFNENQDNGVRLLVIDPHRLFCESIVHYCIAEQGVEVAYGVHCAELIADAVTANRPNVVMLCPRFPRESISGMLNSLRLGRTRVPRSSIVVLDNWFDPGMLRQAVSHRLAGYWTKQSSLPDIFSAIEDACQQQFSFCSESENWIEVCDRSVKLKASAQSSSFEQLSSREYEIAMLLAQGCSLSECAESMGVALSTADNHRWRVFRKLGVKRNVELIIKAFREGLIE